MASLRKFDYFRGFRGGGLGLFGGILVETSALQEKKLAHGALVGTFGSGEMALDSVPDAMAMAFAEGERDAEQAVVGFVVVLFDPVAHFLDVEVEERGLHGNDAISAPGGVDEAVHEFGLDAVDGTETRHEAVAQLVEFDLGFPVVDGDGGRVESVGYGVAGGRGFAFRRDRSGGMGGVGAVGGDLLAGVLVVVVVVDI